MITFFQTDKSNELMENVFYFLDAKTLANCRLVDHRFNNIAKASRLYSDEENKVKNAYEEYLEKKREFTPEYEKLIIESGRVTQAIMRTENNDSHTWFGWFVSHINVSTGIVSFITNFLKQIFPAIGIECERQSTVLKEIQDLKAQKEHADERKSQLSAELQTAHMKYLNEKVIYAKSKIKPKSDMPSQVQNVPNVERVQRQVAQRQVQQRRVEHTIEYRTVFQTVPQFTGLTKTLLMPRQVPVTVPWCVTCKKVHK